MEQQERKAKAGACLARMRNWKAAQAFAHWRGHVLYHKASMLLAEYTSVSCTAQSKVVLDGIESHQGEHGV